jgi:succinate-semialdehyde dehydrogenase / glutarate-semialdehyde dehydrogenase
MLEATRIISANPTTGEVNAEYPPTRADEIAEILRRSQEAFVAWRTSTFLERAAPMKGLAGLLRAGVENHARLMATEMGKPVGQGRSEIQKCALACEYFADYAEEMLRTEVVRTESTKSYVTFQPLGVILAVMPWNFPYWQVFRFAVPALMAGNAAVIKHASNVPGCALAVEQLFRDAGFPKDLVRTFLVGSDAVNRIIESPFVRAITLTGSTEAGKAVAAKAGSLVKKTVLELGGSDPYIVLEDADLLDTIMTCGQARLVNSGQSCIAAKRFIVVERCWEEFEKLLVEFMRQQRVGDPLDPTTEVGPLARGDLREQLHRQVIESVARGARLLLGGRIPDGPGAYYPPTVLTSVAPGMPAYDEELFGPVAAILPVRDEREAVRVANDSSYGLGAAIFTQDPARGERIAAELESGNCFINAQVASDPRMPFGGIKGSGYGRELSHYGIKEFVNIKSVIVR